MKLSPRRAGRTWCHLTVAASLLVGCGSATSLASRTTTTAAPPTTAETCPRFGAETAAPAGPAGTPSGTVLLRNVQVQASACVDEVSFLFWRGTPAWSAGYRDGALTLDPSGQPAVVAGDAHLVIRFEHASGTDLSADPPQPGYDGPTDFSPGAPGGLAEIRRLGDFEGVMTWALGTARRPFEVVTRADQIVVRMAAPAPRQTRCLSPGSGAHVGYPPDWYTELSPRWTCRYFDAAPFVVFPATDSTTWSVTAAPADAPAPTVISRMTAGDSVRSHQARVAGVGATVIDVTTSGAGMEPAGWVFRMYVVDTTPTAFVITSRAAPPGAQADGYRAAADRIASLLRLQ